MLLHFFQTISEKDLRVFGFCAEQLGKLLRKHKSNPVNCNLLLSYFRNKFNEPDWVDSHFWKNPSRSLLGGRAPAPSRTREASGPARRERGTPERRGCCPRRPHRLRRRDPFGHPDVGADLPLENCFFKYFFTCTIAALLNVVGFFNKRFSTKICSSFGSFLTKRVALDRDLSPSAFFLRLGCKERRRNLIKLY